MLASDHDQIFVEIVHAANRADAFIIAEIDGKTLLYRRNKIDDVEAVQPEVAENMRLRRDLIARDLERIHENVVHRLNQFGIRHLPPQHCFIKRLSCDSTNRPSLKQIEYAAVSTCSQPADIIARIEVDQDIPDTGGFAQSPTRSIPNRSADWAQPGIGKTWQHRFFYWLIRIGGKKRGYHMANIIAFWYVLLYPSIRRRCRFYLDRRFPDHRGALRRFLDTYRLVRTFGATLIDIMFVSIRGPGALAVTVPDRDRMVRLCSGDRGFILIHAHVGCWQAGITTLHQIPKAVSIVMLPEERAHALVDPRSVEIIDPRTGLQCAMQMTESLLRGQIVVMMGDRTFGGGKQQVGARFLGGKILLPITPYRLASATGMPVLVMTAPRTAGQSYELRVAKVIDVPPNLSRDLQSYEPYAQQFADCIEEFVRDYPWQFYNFYDFWREAPPEG
jgi:predicted LPLAT superfamily acyltransferase